MGEQLRLKVDSKPTFWNKEALIGTLIFPVIGTLIGGYIGKNRMKREQEEGRPVGEPSIWNKDMLLGGLVGGALVAGVEMALSFTGPTGMVIGAIVGLAGTLIGGYVGGKVGESRQARELEEAKKQTIVDHITRTVSPEVGKAVEYSMEHNKEWGKQVTEDRMLAEAQGHQHHHS